MFFNFEATSTLVSKSLKIPDAQTLKVLAVLGMLCGGRLTGSGKVGLQSFAAAMVRVFL